MLDSRLPDLAAGGACAWQLPSDESGPAMARSLLAATMTAIGVDREVVEDGKLAVSETSTNALRHARPEPGPGPVVSPELWIWARTIPAPQLVVSVFDTSRVALPRTSDAELLEEHGKGLDLLSAFTAEWGSHASRSRLAAPGTRGKAVWFALPLPAAWPGCRPAIQPAKAAHALLLVLKARGIEGRRHSDEAGISVLELPGVNVWIEPRSFSWQAGQFVRHPLLDLQETAEHLIRHVEESPLTRTLPVAAWPGQ
jgi:hypothetical protein